MQQVCGSVQPVAALPFFLGFPVCAGWVFRARRKFYALQPSEHVRFLQFRILTSQTKSGGAFSSDFLSALSGDFDKNGTTGSNTTTDLALNRTYAGGAVPVDVYSVSTSSNVNASSLCAALTSTSSGV